MKAPTARTVRRSRRAALSALAVVLLGLALAGWIREHRARIVLFPYFLAGFSAKEFCQCLYVMERDEAFCRAYTRLYISAERVEADPERRSVIALALGHQARAAYAGLRFACEVVEFN